MTQRLKRAISIVDDMSSEELPQLMVHIARRLQTISDGKSEPSNIIDGNFQPQHIDGFENPLAMLANLQANS